MLTRPLAGVTHHYVLEDNQGTRLGLLSPDNMASFLRAPITRTALKMAQGDTRYSDMEPPYTTEMQEDFSGGRGQRNLNSDKTKFYDSQNVNTCLKNQAFLGPETSSVTLANVGMPEWNPGNVADVWVLNATLVQTLSYTRFPSTPVRGLAQKFVTPTSDGVWIQSVLAKFYLTVAGDVTLSIQANTVDGSPSGTALVSKTLTPALGENTAIFTFDNPVALASNTAYWFVLVTAAYPQLMQGYGASSNPYSDGVVKFCDESVTYWSSMESPYTDSDFLFTLTFAQVRHACSFVFSGTGSYAVTHLYLYLKKSGTVTPTVRIETNLTGIPSGILAHANATGTIANADIFTDYAWVRVDFTSFTLTKGTTYWILLYDATSRTTANRLYWGGDVALGNANSATKVATTPYADWANEVTLHDMYFRINSGQGLAEDCAFLFEYNRKMHAISSKVEGVAASKLWRNGDDGVADSNSADKTKLNDATKAWTVNAWAGCVALITAGAGKDEYRTIVSNTATVLTVSEAWETTHSATTTEYAILGSNVWTDVTPGVAGAYTHTITARVTDVCVVNGILYLAQGDGANILRIRFYNNAGTWDGASAEDGTNKATLLMELKTYVYRATATNQVSKAPVVAWGTNLTFGTADNVGTSDYDATEFTVYDSEVYLGKEDSLWVYRSGTWEKVPINTEPLASSDNFKNMVWHNAYLFFPFGNGLERMYGLQIDDMGPNRDEGLLEGHQGPISDLIPIPGSLYASINAGATGKSSILIWNDLGWHNLVRGVDGERIQCIHMQVIPGGPNRLWFGHGNDVYYAVSPSKAFNPLKDSTYRFRSSGTIITSWIDLGLATVTKYFKDLKIVADRLSSTVCIQALYQLDNALDSDVWALIGDYTTSPYQERSIGTFVTGKRIRFLFELKSNVSTTTPILLAYTIDALAKIPPKSKWEPKIVLRDYAELLDGSIDPDSRADKIAQMDTWAASAEPLYFTSADPAMSDKTVLIEPAIELDKKLEPSETGAGRIVAHDGRLIILES